MNYNTINDVGKATIIPGDQNFIHLFIQFKYILSTNI